MTDAERMLEARNEAEKLGARLWEEGRYVDAKIVWAAADELTVAHVKLRKENPDAE
jgi:hypothetical protein